MYESSMQELQSQAKGDDTKMSAMEDDDMQEEYDFSNSEKAPYAAMAGDVHIVSLDGDVWKSFPDSKAVNAALRHLLEITHEENLPKAS